MEMLKSLFRMDEDQCARRVALKYFDVVDPGYYEFESKSRFVRNIINLKEKFLILYLCFIQPIFSLMTLLN